MGAAGSLQLLVISETTPAQLQTIKEQIIQLQEQAVARLIDIATFDKDIDGKVSIVDGQINWSDEWYSGGIVAGILVDTLVESRNPTASDSNQARSSTQLGSFGLSDDELLEIVDLIPTNSRVLVLLVEQLWEAGLRELLTVDGGNVLASGTISRERLDTGTGTPG